MEELVTQIQFSRRKHITVQVHPDLRVVVRAPLWYTHAKVAEFIDKHSGWIAKHLQRFASLRKFAVTRNFISGEMHYYLGEQYQLQVKCAAKSSVKLMERLLCVEHKNLCDNAKTKKLLQSWYADQAKILLSSRMDLLLPLFLNLGVKTPTIKYRRMKSRWGSCSTRSVITLNTELMKAPISCIDYVVIHELCHLVHHAHNKKFYGLLARILPEWKSAKAQLQAVMMQAL